MLRSEGETEREIYKLACLRKKRDKDLNRIKCIKYNSQQALAEDNETKERWRVYFNQLFYSNHSYQF